MTCAREKDRSVQKDKEIHKKVCWNTIAIGTSECDGNYRKAQEILQLAKRECVH